jgi:hypothetical protein
VISGRDTNRLYQLPLAEFTGARNAMAKAAGKSGGAIRALEKPSTPAWAVNQLYWKQRRTYDKLIRASERVRAGHAQALKGRKIDLATLELQHGAAVRDAAGQVRSILARAGDPATAATMKSVVDTLQALPGGGEPGRLTKPLAPIGFGAFGALMKGAASSKALAEVVTFAPPKPKPDEVAATAKRADEASKRRLRELEAHSKKTAAALKAARVKFKRADAVRAAADAKLQAATAEANRLRAEVSRLEREARAQDQERQHLEPPNPGRR